MDESDVGAGSLPLPGGQAFFRHCEATLDRLLDVAHTGRVASAVASAIEHVERWRRTAPGHWRRLVAEVCAPHALAGVARLCPLTARSRDKPRGYAGDAVMLDLIYDWTQVQPAVDDQRAEAVFRTVAASPTCGSVDFRRHVIARLVEGLARSRRDARAAPPRLLSLACGHARELDFVPSLGTGDIGRLVACDQDARSLATVQQRYGRLGVETRALAVRDFLAGRDEVAELGTFEMVYSAGLYDYLDDRIAARLTQRLFERTAPGGSLVLANFHPDNRGTGYMEAFMDWWLVYRDEAAMRRLGESLDAAEVASIDTFPDPYGNVAYLRVTRN